MLILVLTIVVVAIIITIQEPHFVVCVLNHCFVTYMNICIHTYIDTQICMHAYHTYVHMVTCTCMYTHKTVADLRRGQ